MSGVYHMTGRRKKGKGLEVPCKHNYYFGPEKDPVLIRDLVFVFVIMLFPPTSKQDKAFVRDQAFV